MIRGMPTSSTRPTRGLHAFLRDKLGLPATDVGGGWLLFDLPESDMVGHSGKARTDGRPTHRTKSDLPQPSASTSRTPHIPLPPISILPALGGEPRYPP